MPPPTTAPSDAPAPPSHKLTFLPAITGEYIIDVPERLAELRDVLAQERWAFQHTNVRKAIEMYESGAWPLPGFPEVWLKNGEVFDAFPDKISKGEVLWCEGLGYQPGQCAATPPAA